MEQILSLISLVIDFLHNQFDVVSTIIVILGGLYFVAEKIVKMTKTTKDDELLEKVNDFLEQLLKDKWPADLNTEEDKKRFAREVAEKIAKKK